MEPTARLPVDGDVTGLAWVPERPALFTSTSRGALYIHELVDQDGGEVVTTITDRATKFGLREVLKLRPHEKNAPGQKVGCIAMALHETNGEIATVGSDGSIAISGAMAEPRILPHDPELLSVTGIDWRSSHELVMSSLAGRITLFDLRQRSPSRPLAQENGSPSPLNCVAVNTSQPHILATGGQQGVVQVWDIRNSSRPTTELFPVHSSDVWEVRFNPIRAEDLVTCSEDGSMCVVRWQQPQSDFSVDPARPPLHRIQDPSHKLGMNSVDIHPEKGTVAGGGDAAAIMLSKI
ncbi:Nucleoporin Nup43 [Borealophlyctis nickersoniae]|nr:Nucleoporin Nup43 [Borealophlyctis nickersoniae]